MSTSTIDNSNPINLKVSHTAHFLNSTQRQVIAKHAIGGKTPISHIAERYAVSRKFVYEQKVKAEEAIHEAFSEQSSEPDKVLFYIPVTKKWLIQVVLALIFICLASYQGVIEFFRDIFDCKISKGSVQHEHLQKAKEINQLQDLSRVRAGLHDEIYQAGEPVLVGCCARSTYCYLLSLEESCDANSWGIHLLDLQEKQRLAPNFTVIDGGKAARCGQKEAWPDIPVHGDAVHALKPFLELVCYLENRAMDALKIVDELKHKIEPVRKYLENHRDNLLEFVPLMEMHFNEIAREFEVSLSDVLSLYHLKGLPLPSKRLWQKYVELRTRLGEKFYWIESSIDEVLGNTVRANSLVENHNSRLRTYFTLRRELGGEYLHFLQFFLNHRRFMRSEHKERIGKSPTELLIGEQHKHWLEMLGLKMFKKAA
ncbi:MAG: hypothetical protein H0T62_13410 [Parachlamydiaceae bacterium]|nr:hypothetical protein [Parachlamydiaceae bacterium]